MLKQRVITALVLLAILLPALFYPSATPFAVVVLVLMAAGAWEWGRLSGLGQAGSVAVGVVCVALCAASWALGWLDRPLTGLWIAGGALWVLAAAWLLNGFTGLLRQDLQPMHASQYRNVAARAPISLEALHKHMTVFDHDATDLRQACGLCAKGHGRLRQ